MLRNERTGLAPLRLFLLGALMGGLIACAPGVVGQPGDRGGADDLAGEKIAFEQLLDPDGTPLPQGGGKQAPSPEPPGEADVVDPQLPDTTLAATAKLRLATVSRCHADEYNHILKILKPFINPGTGDYDKKLIASLETNTATLGHLELDPGKLAPTAQQKKKKNALNQTNYEMKLEIPPALVTGDEFDAFLFLCVDLDSDGSCIDEGAAPMQGFDFKSDVVYFVPIKMRANDQGEVEFRALKEGEQAVAPGGAAKKMLDILKNLMLKNVGLPNDNPLTGIITVRAAPATCYVPPPPGAGGGGGEGGGGGFGGRSNGCFVAGTRVSVGADATRPVERLPGGSMIVNAARLPVRLVRSVAGPERGKVIEIRSVAGHRLVVTKKHPMVTTEGLVLADRLTRRHRLLTAARQPVRIASLRRIPYDGLVYNFVLPGERQADHLLVAEGLLTGDLALQHQLSAAAPSEPVR